MNSSECKNVTKDLKEIKSKSPKVNLVKLYDIKLDIFGIFIIWLWKWKFVIDLFLKFKFIPVKNVSIKE